MPKNRSHVSGNRQGKVFFLSLTRPHSRTCIRIYIFNLKKTGKKAKETKEKKLYMERLTGYDDIACEFALRN